MIKHRFFIIVVLLLCLCPIYGHKPANFAEDINIRITSHQDSLTIRLITDVPNYQMSFLMQGLHINLYDSTLNPFVTIVFPNARMVRDRIKHHPNEVKAMHSQSGDEVRPDLLPLISALNDTCCIVNGYDGLPVCCSHAIALDKTSGEMTFSVSILPDSDMLLQDSVSVEILSSPIDMKSEFEGQRLSQENQMPPGGMGQPPKGNNDQSRIIRFSKMVRIETCKEN